MKQFQKIVEKIARENGTTPENVMRQMQRAIDQAYDSRNAGSATMWAGMTFRGEKPTPAGFAAGDEDAGQLRPINKSAPRARGFRERGAYCVRENRE